MRFVMCVMAMLAAATAASARTMPIYNGVLVNDLDAGGHSITNIAAPVNPSDMATKAYVDSTSGMTPSSVTNIASLVVTNDVASWALKPNPAPVADLTPATNYTDAASNNLATAIAEKRGLGDFDERYVLPSGPWTWTCDIEELENDLNTNNVIPIWSGESWNIGRFESRFESFEPDIIHGSNSIICVIGFRDELTHEDECTATATRPINIRHITRTAATSGLAKLGANGVLTTATAADVPGLQSVRSDSFAYTTSVSNKVESDFVPWRKLDYNRKSLVIGSATVFNDGYNSLSVGQGNTIGIDGFNSGNSLAVGEGCNVKQSRSIALGYGSVASNEVCFVWSGLSSYNGSHGNSSFTVNTGGGIDGFWINDKNLRGHITDVSSPIATNAANAVYFANVTGDVQNISAPVATNAATSVFAEIADYALTNLATAAYTLRTSEIGDYETTANFTLTLQFADNGRSGDCLLYVANTDAADHEMSLSPDTYTYVSADLAAAKTLKAATTNLVMFTRVNATTVLVSKTEVK